MGSLVNLDVQDWGQGVVNSPEPDVLANGYTRGWNTALTSIGGGKAVVMKRKGCRCLNTTPVTGSSAIVGQFEFRLASGTGFASYHLLVSENGRLDTINTVGTLSSIDATAFTASTSQEYLPDFAEANNLAFIVNGVDAKKFNGISLSNFGIVRPSTAPTLADSGVAGLHNGTYEARVTFVNLVTGEESSAGPTSSTVTVTSKKITWTAIPVSSDTQVSARKLYLRNTTTQQNFYLVDTITDNTTTTYLSNVSDAALTEIGPDTSENDPPPTGVRYACWHRARMFVADGQNVYYSKIEHPEAFDPDNYEPINPDDGQAITALISAFDILIIFKTDSIWAIIGDDPSTWAISQIDAAIGTVAHRSVVLARDRVFFWSNQGPAQLTQAAQTTLLAPPFISRTVASDNLNFSTAATSHICVAEDDTYQRIMWAVPEASQSRNTAILPYNYRIDRWESDKWDPMDVASMASITDDNGRHVVMLGGYAGQIFKWWDATNDGVVTGTRSGTFVASGASVTTITDLTAAFDTTGGGLVERKVTVVDSAGLQVSSIRPRIASNTSTDINLNTTVVGLTSGVTYTYYIGGPAFDWISFWNNFEKPFIKKRFRFIYLYMRPSSASVMIRVDAYTNYNTTSSTGKIMAFTTSDHSGTWDVSEWDNFLWDIGSVVPKRFRVALTGTAVQVRIRQYAPDQDIALAKLGETAEILTEKLS